MSDPARAVLLLDTDPELAAMLPPDARAVAMRHLRTRMIELDRGRWTPEPAEAWAGHLGLLVLDGVLVRDVYVRGRCCAAELIGASDVIRPWDASDDTVLSVEYEAHWDVLEPARLAVIDARTTMIAARWPPIAEALFARSVRRSRMLALQLGLTQVPGVDVRVHLILWHLADRWGRVTPEGVVLPIRLTHELLGRLIGAQRQSVTSALRRLADDDLVVRRDDGWLLHGAPDEVRLEHAPARPAA